MSTAGRRIGIRAARRGIRRSGVAARRGIGAVAAAVLVSTALVAQGGVTSEAAWNDAEWTGGAVGTSDCTSPEAAFANRGEGRALSGSLLGIDLDALVEASGVEVTNDGGRSLEHSGAAAPLGDDAYANPLNVVALSAVDANLGQGVLQLPLDTSTGALGQYGQAKGDGLGVGASGYVTDTGAIATAPGNTYPDLATLSLSQLLAAVNPSVSALIGELTDVSLTTGAVAGRADLHGCGAAWSGAAQPDELTRDYLASHVFTEIRSDTVDALADEITSVTGTLQTTANGLIGDSGVLSGVIGPVVGTVTSALGLVTSVLGLRVKPNATTATVSALTLDLSPVQDLLTEPFGDAGGVVSVTLSSGLVRVNTAALLDTAYPGEYSDGLNGLAPNTEPLRDPHVLDTLALRLGDVLEDLIDEVDAALVEALDAAQVTAIISIPLQRCSVLCLTNNWVDAGALGVTVTGSLAELLQDEGTVTVDTSVLNSLGLGALLSPLVNALVSGLTGTVGGLVGAAIDTVLRPLAALPPTTMSTLGTPIVALVSTVYRELYLSGVVSLTVNAQNDPLAGSPEPADWAGLPEGRYDVAALRIGVLGALPANDVRLYLGRGSVGPVCSRAGAAAGGCAGY